MEVFREAVSAILIVSLTALSVGLQLLLGESCLRLMKNVPGLKVEDRRLTELIPTEAVLSLGLLLHLVGIFFLKCLGYSWALAFIIPLLPAIWLMMSSRATYQLFGVSQISLNFFLWFSVHILVATSIFDLDDTVTSIWSNNYGDLPFHLGMIFSFSLGDNFPPDYQIFPGTTLSYPFLVNLWTASLSWFAPILPLIKIVFILQWLLVWTIVYFALNGNRERIVPWALFFGGGTIAYFFGYFVGNNGQSSPIALSHTLIDKGYPWTAFLSTMWVPQRSTLLGVAVCAPALKVFFQAQQLLERGGSNKEVRFSLALTSLILALSLLAHTLFALTAILFVNLVMVGRLIGDLSSSRRADLSEAFRRVITTWIFLSCGAMFFPWLLGKAGIIKFQYGWMPWVGSDMFSGGNLLLGSLLMWANNAPLWLLTMLIGIFVVSRRIELCAIWILFLLGNFLLLAIWEWDQIKFFAGLYLISLCFLSSLALAKKTWLQVIIFVSMLPSVLELCLIAFQFRPSVIYDPSAIKLADEIVQHTAPNSIILGRADHNSPVTLTGRRLYYGYEGTLSSHGLPYLGRRQSYENLLLAVTCRGHERQQCPNYLLWSEAERSKWPNGFADVQQYLQPVSGELYKVSNRTGLHFKK